MKIRFLLILFLSWIFYSKYLHPQEILLKNSDQAIGCQSPVLSTDFTTKTSSQLFSVQNSSLLTPVLEDFQVDEDPLPFKSYSPAVASGYYTFMIVWNNICNGRGEIRGSIYGIDDYGYASEITANLQINDNEDASSRCHPAIVDVGDYVTIWTDERNGNKDIFGQYYTFRGEKKGNNFQINDNNDKSVQDFPRIGTNSSGAFVVAWQDSSPGHWDICAQYFDRYGNKTGNNFLVNDDARTSDQMFPDVALDRNGNVVIVWQDNRNGNWDIYGQRFDKNTTKLGSNLLINDNINKADQVSPSVAVESKGNFLVVWQDDRNGLDDIYGQFYLSDGAKQDTNFCINDASGIGNQQPVAEIDRGGTTVKYIVVWQSNSKGITNIYGQLYSDSCVKESGNFMVTNNVGISYTINSPELSAGGEYSGQFIVVWQTQHDENTNIWCQRYDNFDRKNGDSFIVNDHRFASYLTNPLIGADRYGQFTIIWEDDNYILGQSFHSDGTKWGKIFSGNWRRSDAYDFDLALSTGRNFVVVWTEYDYFDCVDRMRYNFFLDDPIYSNNHLMKNQMIYYPQFSPAVAMDSSGRAVIVYLEYEYDHSYINGIYFEHFDLSNGFYFNIGSGTWVEDADVAMNNEGDFIVAWDDSRHEGDNNKDVYCRLFDSSRNPISPSIKVNNNLDDSSQCHSTVGIDDRGNFAIVWEDYRNGDADIYCQYYDAIGNKAGENLKVNDDIGSNYQYNPVIGVDRNGYFVVVWEDNRNDWDIYGQLFGNSGQPIGSNYRVTNDTGNFSQYSPDVCFVNNRIFYTWVDHRQGRHIFARVDELKSTSVHQTGEQIPDQYVLYQNYPNPFNSITIISYDLPQHGQVRLQLFDVHGRLVANLLDSYQPAGHHTVQWNGCNKHGYPITSGIYICRMSAGKVILNRKLVFVK